MPLTYGKKSLHNVKPLGFGMVEILIALLVFAGGILGIAAMQLNGLSLLSNSNAMNIAVLGASDMADRMRANPLGVAAGDYKNLKGSTTVSCTEICTPAQTALLDAYSVKQQLNQSLISPSLEITTTNNDLYTINISWTEKMKSNNEVKQHRFSFIPYKP